MCITGSGDIIKTWLNSVHNIIVSSSFEVSILLSVALGTQPLFGPSGVRALPLAAGINEGGHYFRYWSERRCAVGV